MLAYDTWITLTHCERYFESVCFLLSDSSERMSSKQKYKQWYRKVWENYFFAAICGETVCLLCGFKPSTIRQDKIQRHYKRKHFREYAQYVGLEKHNLIEGLKLVFQQSRDVNVESKVEDGTSSKKALTASYKISHMIAKHSKPFSEGTFIKDCMIEAVNAFGGSLNIEDVSSISLSDKTVASRIVNIAGCIEDELQSLLATCSYFSLCLDESTDNRHISQLSIFARIVQQNFSCVEELLGFVPLHGTTTGADIFSAVKTVLQKFNIDFSKCSAIITDGAKAMTGTKTGFFGQLKQRNLTIPLIHCIIHREALCGKAVKLCNAMQMVTKIINFIKGGNKFLSHRKFQQFLAEHNAVYTDVPLYCEVRWLSAGKCLEKFFAIRKEILLFLQEQSISKDKEFEGFFTNLESLSELAVITDLTNHLNSLNLTLQKANQNISELISSINSFQRKLIVLKNHLVQHSFHFFPCCQILAEEHDVEIDFKQHIHILESVINQFETRFSDIGTLRDDLILFENPLTVPIEEQKLEFQEELCNLQTDISLKARPEKGIEFFKILKQSSYRLLIDFSLRIFSMFGSTYLCETSFSKMKFTKTSKRSSLHDASLSSLMLVSTSNINVDVSSLVESHNTIRKSA